MVMNIEGLRDVAYRYRPYLKRVEFNLSQMSLQRQIVLLSYLKTLRAGLAGVLDPLISLTDVPG